MINSRYYNVIIPVPDVLSVVLLSVPVSSQDISDVRSSDTMPEYCSKMFDKNGITTIGIKASTVRIFHSTAFRKTDDNKKR